MASKNVEEGDHVPLEVSVVLCFLPVEIRRLLWLLRIPADDSLSSCNSYHLDIVLDLCVPWQNNVSNSVALWTMVNGITDDSQGVRFGWCAEWQEHWTWVSRPIWEESFTVVRKIDASILLAVVLDRTRHGLFSQQKRLWSQLTSVGAHINAQVDLWKVLTFSIVFYSHPHLDGLQYLGDSLQQ